MIEEQEIKNYNKTFYKKVASYSRYLAETFEIEIDKQSNRQEKINMEKTSEGESHIKV